MRIAGIAAEFPSWVVTNDDVLDLIAAHSENCFSGDLRRALRRVRHMLSYSGIERRRWRAPGEVPIRMLSRAVSRALAEADCKPEEVDLVIYVGVGGGFCEPGDAYLVAHALGLRSAHCFDVRDACMSWSRALHLVESLFRAGSPYRNALIVNEECSMNEGGYCLPALFTLRAESDLDCCFPAYTIGEAVSATFLVADTTREWEFHFSSRPDLAHFCTIPVPGFEGFCAIGMEPASGRMEQHSRIGCNGASHVTSFAHDLFATFAEEGPKIFGQLQCPLQEIKMVFPHAASKKLWADAAKRIGSPPIYYVYPEYGNIVSASVPAAIDLARQEGVIKRGDRLVGWVGSAGMSFAAYSFIY